MTPDREDPVKNAVSQLLLATLFRFPRVVRLVNRLFRKNQNQILFASSPDYSDNAKAFFEYIHNFPKQGYSTVWLVHDIEELHRLREIHLECYQIGTLPAMFALFRSRYLVSTHGNFANIKVRGQAVINLWHGTPLKGLGFLDNHVKSPKELSNIKKMSDATDLFIATSTMSKIAFSSCFSLQPEKIRILGQPRNDRIFSPDCRRKLEILIHADLPTNKRVVLYVPTFREWRGRNEGGRTLTNVFDFPDYDADRFSQFLVENNILFIVKFHPFEEAQMLERFKTSGELNILTAKDLQVRYFDLYDVLGAVDLLITDYSSIYFDFLLLNRPIVFIPFDRDTYSSNRGFILEPLEFWTPGPKVIDFRSFIDEMKRCLEDPEYYNAERVVVCNITNTYQDDGSCQRLLEILPHLP